MQVSQNVVRKFHSDPTFKPDKDSVVVQLMGQIRTMEDTISSVLVALEYGPDMATIYRLNQIKGTYETTVKTLANLEGVDIPEESQATLEGIANPEGENSDLKSEIIALKKEVGALDERVSQAEMRTAVCGIRESMGMSSEFTLTFGQVYDEINSGGVLAKSGYFTATIEGIYFVSLKTSVTLKGGVNLSGYLRLSSGSYDSNDEDRFIYSENTAAATGGIGYIRDQASASRYVKMAAGETLHISLVPGGGSVKVTYTTMCVSLYSASG